MKFLNSLNYCERKQISGCLGHWLAKDDQVTFLFTGGILCLSCGCSCPSK